MRHKLLERQLRRHCQRLNDLADADLKTELASLLDAVSQAYADFDSDRILTERSQELSSRELEAASRALVEAQSKLLGSAKMSALGEMAGGVAHEINTPLAIIQMRAEDLEEMANDGTLNSDAAIKAAQSITKTVERISKIIKGLRLFARDQRGDPMTLAKVPVIVTDTLGLCQERLQSKGVRLTVGEVPDIAVECRPVEISQILLNLLNNAADAIELTAEKWIEVEVRTSDHQVHFLVTDCGTGIPSSIREKIMQPFFTTKEIGKGTGIGLSLSKGIAENHGGSLRIDEACANTRFVLTLPKRQADSKAA
jgi:C4-dicarboxylate-specific signal transduction histidine kinase